MKRLEGISEYLRKLPILAGEHPFQFFLVLAGLGLAFSLVLFLVSSSPKDRAQEDQIRFQEQAFERILEIWKRREQAFQKKESGPVRDPFQSRLTEQ